MAERVTHLPRRCAATLLHLNTRSRTGPRFGASTQAQPGRGRGTHKLLSTPGAQRVSKPPPLQRERVRARCMGPARTLANAGGAGAGSTRGASHHLGNPGLVLGGAVDHHARRQHSHPQQGEPARTHPPHASAEPGHCTRRKGDRRRAFKNARPRRAGPPVDTARPAARRDSEQRAAAPQTAAVWRRACRGVWWLHFCSYFGN